ncbi:MAG TPA: DNA mismatch repair endonuclease MutH [Methylophaga aminisulfidivorans]|uniref:DNA mismatch repair protein MutH n=1 Tax=Methylophaga aminisulfidivorans TaxID=230105 RepID=A0A7C1VQH1_9GAMM|nr:DNA mismatch repair endonuclease MutH [Methylophaga aminisulfidivorans]
MRNSAPQSISDLENRCQLLAGKTLGQLATELSLPVPDNLLTNKGWVGQLLEQYLGADAGNLAEPDFTTLDIELKTLPLNTFGEPKESTYVCTVSLKEQARLTWENSWVKRKLAHVLWVPIESDTTIPLAERYVGQAWLWQPTNEQEKCLKQDWEELMDRLAFGEQAELTAREGQYLQVRPKAANSRVMAKTSNSQGDDIMMNPRGFYLRTVFTKQLLAEAQK